MRYQKYRIASAFSFLFLFSIIRFALIQIGTCLVFYLSFRGIVFVSFLARCPSPTDLLGSGDRLLSVYPTRSLARDEVVAYINRKPQSPLHQDYSVIGHFGRSLVMSNFKTPYEDVYKFSEFLCNSVSAKD